MNSINFLGSYSGIDKSMVDKLMEVERLPLVQLSNKKTSMTDKQNAWRDINVRLKSLFDKINVLQSSDIFSAKTATSSNEKVVTIDASKNAAEGTYKIHVERLATNTSIISEKIPRADGDFTKALDIEGSFTIKNHDEDEILITIEDSDTLKSISEKINHAGKDIGINSTVIDGRLVLSDSKTGDRDLILTDVGDETLAKLGLDETARTLNQGVDGKFTINGVTIERSSNNITDAVDGLTINLKKEHGAGEYETVKVTLDTDKLSKALQDFVDQYNSTMSFIDSKLKAGDPKVPGSAGTLAGDITLMRLQSTLRNYVTSSISNTSTDIKDISSLGITTVDKFGQLKFESSKLTEAFKKDPQNVKNFFISKDSQGKEIGFAKRLKSYVDSFISTENGIIKGKTDSFERILKDLNKQIENFNVRMEKKEAYYIKMFTALDVALMKAESQSTWLQGQIDAMGFTNRK